MEDREGIVVIMSLYNSPLVIGELQLNYLWPQYSLPWNNFFGRVQPNPFYLQNQLRNLTIAEVNSPTTFRSNPIVSTGEGSHEYPAPKWSDIEPRQSLEQTSSATKVFVGPYVDIGNSISGLEYQYDYSGRLVHTSKTGIQNFVYLVLNLRNGNPSTVNFPAYVQPGYGDDNDNINTCYVGDRARNYSTLTGAITASAKNSCPGDDVILCLDDALPIGPCAAHCHHKDGAGSFYYINGNRLYIAVYTGANPSSDSEDSSCGSSHSAVIFHINYQVTIRIVETTTPLQKALNPLLPFPAPIL